MAWITAANSDIGGRKEQQDRYLVEHSVDGNSHLLVVADGAGGHKTGALAAQTAVDCISENLPFLWSNQDPDTFLSKLIVECNDRVLEVGEGDLACTTLVLVFIRNDEVFWSHVGDSRFYLIRGDDAVIQTIDHSVIELQRQQATQDADIAVSASSNEIYMCLGALADIFPEVASSVAREGDTLILCSDGLWGQIEMGPLIAELNENPLSIAYLNSWIEKARVSKFGSSDNITLVAARFTRKPKPLSRLVMAIADLFKSNG